VEAKHLVALMTDVDQLVSSRWGLQKEITYLKELARQIGDSPLSSRFADKLDQVVERLGRQGEGFEETCMGVERQIRELRQAPLDSIFRRLFRPVRDAARQEKKLVEFEAHDGDVQVDRAILDGMYGPLLHIVRNAVAHGIESPEDRQAKGKEPTGNVRLTACAENGLVVVSVQDDGAGIDFERILAKARRLGLADPDMTPDREELVSFIFHPGFSTAESTSDLAGRGVGMDVVAREVAALQGKVEIASKPGEGTTVRLTLPSGSSDDS
jgi:two-component system chemotaxis sensor kinase CheA